MKVKEFSDGPATEEHNIDSIDGVRTSAGPIAMMACAVFIVFGVLLHFEAVPHPPTLAGVTALIPIGVLFLLRVDALKTLTCLLYTSPSPRDRTRYRMPSSA